MRSVQLNIISIYQLCLGSTDIIVYYAIFK